MTLARMKAEPRHPSPDCCHADNRAALRSQSAMEYLMTYGWAILVIAIVIVALYQLGIFGSSNVAPKAPAGGCEILRSSQGANLEGQCSGELPEFTAKMTGCNTCAGDIPPGVSTVYVNAAVPNSLSAFTVSAWVDPNSSILASGPCVEWPILFSTGGYLNNGFAFALGSLTDSAPVLFLGSYATDTYAVSTAQVSLNSWTMVSATYLNGNGIMYINGAQSGAVKTGMAPMSGFSSPQPNLVIGFDGPNWACEGHDTWFAGQISNVQFYNASFSASQIQELYLEGIGGAPLEPQYTVGWWPLNGNAQDYSGNSNEGVPANIEYTGAWTSGYTTP